MRLIATHEYSDFDAIAACVAAQRLDDGAVIGLGRRLSRDVRDYWALHKDRFEARRMTSIDPAEVTRLTVVDLRSRRRLKHVEPILRRRDAGEDVELRIFDHHPASEDDLVGDVHVVEPQRAVTPALVQRLRAAGVEIDPTEATLFALGIHADTGSLTLTHTTPRDVRAVAWLLEQGADLAMIDRYLHPAMGERQREALATVLQTARREPVGDTEVGIATLRGDEPVEGLAAVTSEARRLGGFEGLLTFFEVPRKSMVQVIGRSRSPLLDVGQALRRLGGGGHRGAASAVIKEAESVEAVVARALEVLRDNPPRPRFVGEVMTRPVLTVAPDATLEHAGHSLRAWGVQGAPVVRDGVVLGVLSLRDVEKARSRGRGTLPVSSHMSNEVRSTAPDEPLDRVLEAMVRHDIGRLPVLDGDTLVGIVTRTDVRRCLYASRS